MKAPLLAALLLATGAAHAAPPDTTARPPRPWFRPRHVVLQTGGGLGMVAGGAGYVLLKNRLETDLLIGYVPRRYAGSALALVSLKVMYSPWQLRVAERVRVVPVTLGGYLSYTHGTLNDGQKGQYPRDYYWFSTDTRYGALLGGRVACLMAPLAATGQPRKLAFCYELGTNDLYVATYLTNRGGAIGVGQLVTLALGVKVDF
ncbi:hypothetical protein [Hymenobacter sp. IS2118]|uniref:hypothetical protein n=1 Tax=Hymenobacter sp. IS2118 TaxID=1505605 RepID=UPI0005586738|nr:hypothetical protein [Hymenobacter sp. IS2118]